MLHRILRALQDALGLRGSPSKVQDPFTVARSETLQLYDGFFRAYIRHRFGPDAGKCEAILRRYEAWFVGSGEFLVHHTAADGRGVLVPVQLLDALAAELGIGPVTLELPPWAIDEVRDDRFLRSYGAGFLARDPEGVLSVAELERDRMRALADRYPLDATAPTAT
jgi:hypothetical protein